MSMDGGQAEFQDPSTPSREVASNMQTAQVVLRNVPLHLSKEDILQSLRAQHTGILDVCRFERSKKGPVRVPLQLVRVVGDCPHSMQRLLCSGAIFGAVCCPAEAPRTALDSAAARGKVSFDSKLLATALSLCEHEAMLYPLVEPTSLHCGQFVFCPDQDRVSRGGWHGFLRAFYADATAPLEERVLQGHCAREDASDAEKLGRDHEQAAEGCLAQSATFEPGGVRQDLRGSGIRQKLQAGNCWSVQPLFGSAAVSSVPENRVIPMLSGQSLQSQLHGRAATELLQDVLLVCATTAMYRRLAAIEVHQLDCVLEIGCDLGATTALMHARCGKAIGVDLSDSSISTARANHPASVFRQLDIFQHGAFDQVRELALAMHGCTTFSKVFIDINGNRPRDAVAKAVLVVRRELSPSLIVVKSSELHAWVSTARKKPDE